MDKSDVCTSHPVNRKVKPPPGLLIDLRAMQAQTFLFLFTSQELFLLDSYLRKVNLNVVSWL